MTPRQKIIVDAASKLSQWKLQPKGTILTTPAVIRRKAHAAVESVIDNCKTAQPGTPESKMLFYYRTISERAVELLISAVIKYQEPTI